MEPQCPLYFSGWLGWNLTAQSTLLSHLEPVFVLVALQYRAYIKALHNGTSMSPLFLWLARLEFNCPVNTVKSR